MIKLTFVEPSGQRRDITATPDQSVMQAATREGIDGIDAECGGSCMCATCHCLVLETPQHLPLPERAEMDTLEFTAEKTQESSRLTCQIAVTPEMDGAVFQVVGR